MKPGRSHTTDSKPHQLKPLTWKTLVWGLQRSCAGRKWRWRYQPQRHLRPAHDRWSPQTKVLPKLSTFSCVFLVLISKLTSRIVLKCVLYHHNKKNGLSYNLKALLMPSSSPSSAYLTILISEWFEQIKSVHIENKTGERTQPWGHPMLQFKILDLAPPTLTNWRPSRGEMLWQRKQYILAHWKIIANKLENLAH